MIIQTEDHLFLRDETRHPCCAEGRSANNENTAAGGRWPVLSRATRPRHYLAVLPRKKSGGDRNERLLKITASSDRSSPPIFLDIFVFLPLFDGSVVRWLLRYFFCQCINPIYDPRIFVFRPCCHFRGSKEFAMFHEDFWILSFHDDRRTSRFRIFSTDRGYVSLHIYQSFVNV